MQKRGKHEYRFLGNYIQGQFSHPVDQTGEWDSRSPADTQDVLARIPYGYRSVDDAVGSARTSFSRWRKTSIEERASLLRKYQESLKSHSEQLAEAIAREVGKPLWEAKNEVQTMVNKVDVTLADSMKRVADLEIPNIMPGTAGFMRHKPHGVMAVIGPFNFPGHLANGHIVPALAMGNTVVFKPSEKSPVVGQLMAECFHEAGFPAGVFNLVQGEKEVGRRLVVHEGVNGVLFTGSYEVGLRIKQETLQQSWKLLALEMGGKNSAIVWSDADIELAVYETLFGGFVTAGQRCSATARVIVHEAVLDHFLTRLHDRSKSFEIGHPLDNPFMGPLIDSSSVDRYLKFQGIAVREGAETIMRGKALEVKDSPGHYVTPSIYLQRDAAVLSAKRSVYQQTELFAPNLLVLPTQELSHAIELANATQYGLVGSVFTASRDVFSQAYEDLEAGLVNWNKSTAGASSRLPFGGLKKSGNHFPTALTATQYCAYPVGSLECPEAQVPQLAQRPLGLNWE